MPSTFGAPAKVNVMEEDNKVKIKLISYNERGSLTNVVSTTLKNNILEYLSEYRMINDYLEIESGEVIDLEVEIDIYGDRNESETEIVRSVIETTTQYFSIDKRKMGDPLFIGDLFKEIGTLSGVVSVIVIKVFGKVGGEYSTNEVSVGYVDTTTKEIRQSDMTIFMKSNQIPQIRFPNKDIKVRVKPYNSSTF
jgi:hypothetical protein